MPSEGMITKLRGLLIKHEGLKYKPYHCPAGKLTVGIGHNIDARGLPSEIRTYLDEHGEITNDMVNILFSNDVSTAVVDCIRLYSEFSTFTERRRLALVDFLFNVGLQTARSFVNTNQAINEGRWEDAANGLEDSKWFSQVKSRGVEIVAMIREG